MRNRSPVFAIVIMLCAISAARAQIVANGSFETPVLSSNSFQYDPSGATWTFSGNSGIINAPGGGFSGPPAPDGSQYGFLQTNGVTDAFSQQISLTLAGTYQLTYLVAGRSDPGAGFGGNLPYQILLDGTVIASDATTSGQPFTSRIFDFVGTAGAHTLTFAENAAAGADNTAFFDSVAIRQVPEPASVALLSAGAIILAARRGSKRSQRDRA